MLTRRRLLAAGLALAAAPAAARAGARDPRPGPGAEKRIGVNIELNRVIVYAEVNPALADGSTPHWGVASRAGRLAERALLVTRATPVELYEALEAIGGRPGHLSAGPPPGSRVEGDPLEVTVIWAGRTAWDPLGAVFEDSGGQGFAVRFGGNRAAAERLATGCLTCFESCAVGITSNASYPVADWALHDAAPASRFSARPGLLPRDGRPVLIGYRVIRTYG